MKLAVIGSGPQALYAAAHFYRIGAHVVLFQRSPLGGNARFCLKNNLPIEIDYPETKSVQRFWEEDLVPLIQFVEEENLTKAGDVLRVHKRFLHSEEKIENRSRLADLFRVIYSINPQDSILKQVAENPEIFKQLGENVLESLHEPVESFEDFDIIIEATGFGKEVRRMGPSGVYALNEKNLAKHSHFYYDKEFFINFNFENKKRLMVVGNTTAAVLAVLKLEDWLLSNDAHQLFWITHQKISNEDKVAPLMKKVEQAFENKKIIFEKEMHAYRELEDYVAAKVQIPTEPSKQLHLFEGYNVTSVDKLLDRDGVFVTIESPDFRNFVEKEQDLKTIPVDAVIIQQGVTQQSRNGVGTELLDDEPGHYRIESSSLKDGILQILDIEKKVMQFFSKSNQ